MNSLKHNNWKLYSTSHPKGSWRTLKSYQSNSIPSHKFILSNFSFQLSFPFQRQRELGPAFNEERWKYEKEAELVAGEWNPARCPCRTAQGRHSPARFLPAGMLIHCLACSIQELGMQERVQSKLLHQSQEFISGTLLPESAQVVRVPVHQLQILSTSVAIVSIWFPQFSTCCLQH